MKKIIFLFLLTTNAFAVDTFQNGVIVQGHVSGSVASTSNTVEIQGTSDVGLGLYRSGTANTTDEGYIAFFAKDDNGSIQKTGSISSLWGNTSGTNGFNLWRYNATYLSGGVQYDDISIRQFGGYGVTINGTDDGDVPSDGVRFLVRGKSRVAAELQVNVMSLNSGEDEPATDSGHGKIWLDNLGNVKIKLPDGTIMKFVLTSN